jgi:hypothetical protein
MVWPALSKTEIGIIRRLKFLLKLPAKHISRATKREPSTIWRVCQPGALRRTVGKPGPEEILSSKDVQELIRKLGVMIRAAKACYEITSGVALEAAGLECSEKTAGKALLKRGICFRRMCSKPLLTAQDKRDRFAFAKKYRCKSRAWWLKHIHMTIDSKHFPVYVHAQGRNYAAMREVRGAYRLPGQGLDEGYIVVPKGQRYNPGVKSAQIAAGVGRGRVRMWHVVAPQWNGRTAAQLYKGPLKQALKRAWPGKRTHRVLEDNDPSGFKSGAGKKAKKEAGIDVFEIPKRSPDLNVCDYALWKRISRAMRKQERNFPKEKRETRDEYLARLAQTARGLPRSFIDNSIGDMAARCRRLYACRGGLIEEGGRQSRS